MNTRVSLGRTGKKRLFVWAFLFLFAFSMVSGQNGLQLALAVGPAPTINIASINGLPPGSYSCPDNPVTNPVQIVGAGTGYAPPGQIDQYAVQVDWGDGNVENDLGVFTPSSGQGPFLFIYQSSSHQYAAGGTYTIKAKLYHSQPPGQDNQGDSQVLIEICVTTGEEPYCGDGIVNGEEECDGTEGVGEHQSCDPVECTLINLTYCGDGIQQSPNDEGTDGPQNDGYEDCDGTDGVGENQECSQTCVLIDLPYCGDGIINNDEQCDGQEGVGEHQACDVEFCTLIDLTYCGDAIQQSPNDELTGGPQNDGYEDCDGTDGVTEGYLCTNNCVSEEIPEGPYCGDGIINNDEQCDGQEGVGEHQACDPIECTLIDLTYCGDDIKQSPNDEGTGGPQDDGNEECDGQDGVPENMVCNQQCELELGEGEFVCGYKFYDLNQDGQWNQPEEYVLEGWTINFQEFFHDVWNNLFSEVTDEDGYYCFSDLEPGNYRVEEVLQEGWLNSTPLNAEVHIEEDSWFLINFGNYEEQAECVDADADGFYGSGGGQCEILDCNDDNFDVNPDADEICDDGIDNNCDGLTDEEDTEACPAPPAQTHNIQFCKWEDLTGNGASQDDEPYSLGWIVSLFRDNDGFELYNSGQTGENGCNLFTDVENGTYYVSEQTKDNWTATDVLLNGTTTPFLVDSFFDVYVEINLDSASSTTTTVEFYNQYSSPPEPYCGDGIINNDEQCDGQEGVGEHQACDPVECTLIDLTYCGDGIQQSPNDEATGGPQNDGYEDCDGTDGVTEGYRCTNSCVLEEIPEGPDCGDGSVNQESEQCDDGNTNSGDGCSASCQSESTGGGGGGGGGGFFLYIHSEQSQDPTSESITITWHTNKPATTRVVYDTVSHPLIGYAPNYGYAFSTTEDSNKVTFHSVTITGLTPGTTYYFRPISAASPEVYGIELAKNTAGEPTPPEEEPTPPTTPGGPTTPTAPGGPTTPTTPTTGGEETGVVAGAEFEDKLAQILPDQITEQPEDEEELTLVTQTESDEAETDCTAYIWLLLILNVIAAGYAWNKERQGAKSKLPYGWLIGLLLAIVPVIIWYPACWLIAWLIVTFIILIVVISTTEKGNKPPVEKTLEPQI